MTFLNVLRAPVRGLKRLTPRGLFGRTLLIIVLPTVLTLAVATYVFFNRHWYVVTQRLTTSVAGDIAAWTEVIRTEPDPARRDDLIALAATTTNITITFSPGESLAPGRTRSINPLRTLLNLALKDQLDYPFVLRFANAPRRVAVSVQAPEGLFVFEVPLRRIYTPTGEAFIAWMVGSALALSLIALLFMRGQVRPIRRLAEAAEAIGKGSDVGTFRPEGAAEVRQAGAALLAMRGRLRRQITQRTSMLAGVSHDLRTPLTRIKLQVALMPESPETKGLAADVAEMEGMVGAYLAFARGEEAEPMDDVPLATWLKGIVDDARREGPTGTDPANLSVDVPTKLRVILRPQAARRVVMNLIANARRYGSHVQVAARGRTNAVDITVDDDGPGIPVSRREEAFRPFCRLDEARTPGEGGVGLGLTVARDIARSHGGDVVLEDSPLGGLRARFWVPL